MHSRVWRYWGCSVGGRKGLGGPGRCGGGGADLEAEATARRGFSEGGVDGLQQWQVLLVQQVHLLRV